MALDGCGYFCKYVLFIFNLIFAVVGLAFLGLGLWLRFSENTRGIFQIEALNSSAFVMIVTVLIILGSVMLIVVMFGDYGSCGEKICALQVFSTLVSILAIAEFVVGVLAWSQREEIGLSIAEFYTSLYALYVSSGGDPAIGVTLMFIQGTLRCCGLTGITVMEVAQKTCPRPDGFLEHIKMDSCPVVIATIFDSKATLVMWLFIGTGVLLPLRLGGLLVTTGIVGLCGLYKEKRCALKVFSVLVFILGVVKLIFIILSAAPWYGHYNDVIRVLIMTFIAAEFVLFISLVFSVILL